MLVARLLSLSVGIWSVINRANCWFWPGWLWLWILCRREANWIYWRNQSIWLSICLHCRNTGLQGMWNRRRRMQKFHSISIIKIFHLFLRNNLYFFNINNILHNIMRFSNISFTYKYMRIQKLKNNTFGKQRIMYKFLLFLWQIVLNNINIRLEEKFVAL